MASRDHVIQTELMRCERELVRLGVDFTKTANLGVQISFADATPTGSNPKRSYTISLHDKKITIEEEFPGTIPKEAFEQALKCKKFQDWCQSLDEKFFDSPYTFNTIVFTTVKIFPAGVGFILLNAIIKAPFKNLENSTTETKPIPGLVLVRGVSVAVLVIVSPIERPNKKYAVVTVQPRLAAGKSQFWEIPAGMLDDSGDFAGVAAKEIKEETGLEIKSKDLIPLLKESGLEHPDGVYPSVGGCDETIRFFLYEAKLPMEKIKALNNTDRGNPSEGEKIQVKVIKKKQLASMCPDMKALTALYLYNRYQMLKPLNDTKKILEAEYAEVIEGLSLNKQEQ